MKGEIALSLCICIAIFIIAAGAAIKITQPVVKTDSAQYYPKEPGMKDIIPVR